MRGAVTLLVISATFAALVGTGCSARRVTDFTLISTKNTLLTAHAETKGSRIDREDCSVTLFGVPNMKTAIDDALDNAPDKYDALVDGVIFFEDRFFYVCYRVEGTPIKARDPEKIWGTPAVTTEEGNRFTPREPKKPTKKTPKTPERRPDPKRIEGEAMPDESA